MILIVDYFMHVPITFYLHDGSSGSYSDDCCYFLRNKNIISFDHEVASSYRYSNYVKKKFKP